MDTFLTDGLAEEDVDRWVGAASILHSDGDAMDIAVKDEQIVGVRGRAQDRVNRGRLGPKDLFGWQANTSPDRLTRPLVRQDDQLVETDWDTAMDQVVARTQELLSQRGPSSLGFYTTGQLMLEEYYTLTTIVRAGLGTAHLDGNTRLCTATAADSLKESFACDGQPGSYSDLGDADVIALYGRNVAETQPVLWTRMLDRLAGPNPPRLLCVELQSLSEAHPGHQELYHVAKDLTLGSDAHLAAIEAAARERDVPLPAPSTSRVHGRVGDDLGGVGLLEDLRTVYLCAADLSLEWVMLGQAAQTTKDAGLLQLSAQCHPQTLRQRDWANQMIKAGSPQLLSV